jgi:hypothetical protein
MRLRLACNLPGRSLSAEALTGLERDWAMAFGTVTFAWPFYSPWAVGLHGDQGPGFAALQGHGHLTGSAIGSDGRFAAVDSAAEAGTDNDDHPGTGTRPTPLCASSSERGSVSSNEGLKTLAL